jgi:hypothetical protein
LSYGGTDIVQRTTAKFACAKLPCQAIILAPHQYYFYYFFDNQIGRLNPANPLIYLNEDVRQAAPNTASDISLLAFRARLVRSLARRQHRRQYKTYGKVLSTPPATFC